MISNLSSRVKTRRYDLMRRKNFLPHSDVCKAFYHTPTTFCDSISVERSDACRAIRPVNVFTIRVVLSPISYHRRPQARNAVSETSGIRDSLPTRIAFLTDIAPWRYQPMLPSVLYRITAGIITRFANRATLITVACGNLHYGLAVAPTAVSTILYTNGIVNDIDITNATNPYYRYCAIALPTDIVPPATGKKPVMHRATRAEFGFFQCMDLEGGKKF